MQARHTSHFHVGMETSLHARAPLSGKWEGWQGGLETGKHRRESAFAGAEPRCASVAGLCPRTPSAVGSGDTTTLPTLPCQTAAWTAEPPGAEPWGPPRGSLIPLCLFQKEANLLLCQAALAQSRRGEKRERVGSVTEKGHDESHPLPGRASPDATRLISSPEVWPASHRGAAAPGRRPRGPQASLLPHPLRGGRSGQPGCCRLRMPCGSAGCSVLLQV